jgi:hypothetical protein
MTLPDHDSIAIKGTATVTPEFLATLFWNMDSKQQVRFFAELERIAGVKLCMQMAYVVDEIAETCNRDAQNGFQTMLAHAQHYVTSAIDHRHAVARRAVEQRT